MRLLSCFFSKTRIIFEIKCIFFLLTTSFPCFPASKHTQKVDAEHVRKIREDYEKKLTAMRDEFKKLQSVEREHRRMQAKQAAEQQQLLRLRNELNELKKTKVSG